MRKVKKENGSETQHVNFWRSNGALGFTCEFGCSSIASDKKYAETPYQRPPAKTLAPTRKNKCFSIASTARSYKKKLTSPILFPLKHGA